MNTRCVITHFATCPGLALVRIYDRRMRLRRVFLIDNHGSVSHG